MPKLAVALMAVFVMIRPLPGALKMLGDREKEEEALLHSFFCNHEGAVIGEEDVRVL